MPHYHFKKKKKKQYMHGILRALQVPVVHEKETSETQ